MAFYGYRTRVGRVPTDNIASGPGVGALQGLYVINSGDVIVYLGGPTVTVDDGFPLWPGRLTSWDGLDAMANEEIYAIAAPGISGEIRTMVLKP